MNKLQRKITNINFIILTIVLLAYSLVRVLNTFLSENIKGDEASFLEIFKIFIEKGYYHTNVLGNSSLFNLTSFLFYKIGFNELTSLRMTSLFYGVLCLAFLWYFQKKIYSTLPKLYTKIAFITSVNVLIVMSFIFVGINDSMLAFFTVLLFILFFNLKKENNNKNYMFLGIVLALMLLTRKMSVLFFLPVCLILLSHFMLNKFSFIMKFKKIIIISLSLILVIGLFNIPSLNEKGKISFHQKELRYEGVNWIQLHYLTALSLDKGKIKYGKHHSPKEVKEYIELNGKKSLPKNYFESITFNYLITIKSSVREFIYLIKPMFRLLGIIFILNILFFIIFLYERKINIKKMMMKPIFVFSTIYICILCFIVTSYVEGRWLMNVAILLPFLFMERIYYFLKNKKSKNNLEFIVLNLQITGLLIMNLPYIYKNIDIFFK